MSWCTFVVFIVRTWLFSCVAVASCDSTERKAPRIAIVGSGMAGASTAWRLAHDTKMKMEITVFEADDRIGGRLDEVTVHGQFEAGVTEKLIELGGTMGIEANRYFVEATDMLNLTRKSSPDGTFGIFDGEKFTMTSETPLWRKAWRYGWSPYFQHRLTSSIVEKFLNIYDLQDQGVTFSSALHLWKGLGIADLLEVSLSQHLRESTKVFGMPTINSLFIEEVVAGQVRVNYNQNPHEMAALAGHIGLAPDSSAFKVAEGTSRLPQGLLHLSGAVVRLHSKVTHISRDGSSWKVRVAGGEHSERFDMVVVAAPVSRANITFSGVKLEGSMMRARDESVADIQGDNLSMQQEDREEVARMSNTVPGNEIEDVDYQTVYTTYVRGNPNPGFFKSCEHGTSHTSCTGPSKMPDIVLTSENSNTSFSCVGTFWKDPEGSDDVASDSEQPRLSKLFSTAPLTPAQLDDLFLNPKVYAEKFWKAYPVFTPPEREEGRMHLAPGLYYTNALEAGASCIEIAAVAGRNVAMLVRNELLERAQVESETCTES